MNTHVMGFHTDFRDCDVMVSFQKGPVLLGFVDHVSRVSKGRITEGMKEFKLSGFVFRVEESETRRGGTRWSTRYRTLSR